MAEFLLDSGADVNAQDKGGLIPLHNASSYGVGILEGVGRKCRGGGMSGQHSTLIIYFIFSTHLQYISLSICASIFSIFLEF